MTLSQKPFVILKEVIILYQEHFSVVPYPPLVKELPFVETVSQVYHYDRPKWEECHKDEKYEGKQSEVKGHSLLLPEDQVLSLFKCVTH